MPTSRATTPLALARQARGLSQADLGRMVGRSQQTIAKLELGQTTIDGDHLLALSQALGTTPNDLLGVATAPPVAVVGVLTLTGEITPPIRQQRSTVPALWGMQETDRAIAFGVLATPFGTGFEPHQFVYASAPMPPSRLINRGLTVVEAGGRRWLAIIMPGSVPERFHLWTTYSPALWENVEITAARRIEGARRDPEHP